MEVDTEQPATESEVVDSPEVDENIVSADEPDQDNPEPVESDDEEIDYEGEKYKVNRKLKDAFLRQADYTTKTQSLAQQRTDFEAAQTQFVQRQQFQQQHLQSVARVMAIDERLEQFSKLDWNALTDADPVQAMKLDREMRSLQTQKQQHVAAVQRAMAESESQSSQATARRLEEGRTQLARDIPGYGTPEVQKALGEAAKAIGYKPEELANVNDPRAVKLLHKAYLYDKLVAARKAPEAKPDVAPITRVSGAQAVTTKDPSRMSDSEFAKWRKQQIAKR